MSVDMADLSECTARVQAAVSACIKRVGIEEHTDPTAALGGRGTTSALGRLRETLAARVSAGSGTPQPEPEPELGIALATEGEAGGLYLASD